MTADGVTVLRDGQGIVSGSKKQQQRETVRWVLGAPRRLQVLLDAGKGKEAVEDWGQIQTLMGKWVGIDGVDDIRDTCMKIMESQELTNGE